MDGGLLETPTFEGLSAMAVQAALHGKALPSVAVLLNLFRRTMTVAALHACRKMKPVVEHHVFGQDSLVQPGEFLGTAQGGIQFLDSRIFGQGQPMAVHAVRLGRQVGVSLVSHTCMTMGTIQPDGIPVKSVVKGNISRSLDFGSLLTAVT